MCCAFEIECATLRRKGNKLTTLLKIYQKYNPYLDEQVCLAHVINTLVSNRFMISKTEIYYAFKKNYNRDFHGDVSSYLNWLYSLAQPSQKTPNNSISEQKQAQNRGFFDLDELGSINTPKSQNKAQNNNILCRENFLQRSLSNPSRLTKNSFGGCEYFNIKTQEFLK